MKKWYEIETGDYHLRMETKCETLEDARKAVEIYRRHDIEQFGATPGYNIFEVVCNERKVQ